MVHTGDHIQQGGFTSPGFPQHTEKFPREYLKRDLLSAVKSPATVS